MASVALPQYQKAVWRSRLSTVKSLTSTLAQAQELYYMAHGNYTTEMGELDIEGPSPSRTDISASYGNYYYPWGYCQIEVLEVVAKVACRFENNGSAFLGYTRYLNYSPRRPGQITCVSYNGKTDLSALQQQICKSETHLSTPTAKEGVADIWAYTN